MPTHKKCDCLAAIQKHGLLLLFFVFLFVLSLSFGILLLFLRVFFVWCSCGIVSRVHPRILPGAIPPREARCQRRVETLFLSSNSLASLAGVEQFAALRVLSCANNGLATFEALDPLRQLKALAVRAGRQSPKWYGWWVGV